MAAAAAATTNNGNVTAVNVGLGLSCPYDEATPSPPAYPQADQEWCVKKYQKLELASTKQFATPEVPGSSSTTMDYPYMTSVSGMPKISPVQQQHVENTLALADVGAAAVVHPTSPITTAAATVSTNKTAGNSLPENIMEDSPIDMNHEVSGSWIGLGGRS